MFNNLIILLLSSSLILTPVSKCSPLKLNHDEFNLLFNTKLKLNITLDIFNITSSLCENLVGNNFDCGLKSANHIVVICNNCSKDFRET